MKVFYCVDHAGHYPVGAASVVVAENEEHARQLLDEALRNKGLLGSEKHPYTLVKISTRKPSAIVLVDGDY